MESEEYVPYVSMDPLHDPKSFTYRQKVIRNKYQSLDPSFGDFANYVRATFYSIEQKLIVCLPQKFFKFWKHNYSANH